MVYGDRRAQINFFNDVGCNQSGDNYTCNADKQ